MELKTLRLCLSSELPERTSRSRDFLYLLYDKLILYYGQNEYYDPYVICEKVPGTPVDGYIYILFDGTVKTVIGNRVIDLALIENETQKPILTKIGTSFFMRADRRYLDKRNRTLQIPYKNGTYSLTVDVAKDLKIDSNVIIRYDESTESFYIDGNKVTDPSFVDYQGKNTQSVSLDITDHLIRANVNISKASSNMIQLLSGGLYVSTANKADITEFYNLLRDFNTYKANTDSLRAEITSYMTVNNIVDRDNLVTMIRDAVAEYGDEVNAIVEYYNTVYSRLNTIMSNCKEYTDEKFEEVYTKIMNSEIVIDPWGSF